MFFGQKFVFFAQSRKFVIFCRKFSRVFVSCVCLCPIFFIFFKFRTAYRVHMHPGAKVDFWQVIMFQIWTYVRNTRIMHNNGSFNVWNHTLQDYVIMSAIVCTVQCILYTLTWTLRLLGQDVPDRMNVSPVSILVRCPFYSQKHYTQ